MKKGVIFLGLLFFEAKLRACSSCSRDFTLEDKIAFGVATFILMGLIFAAGWVVYKIFTKYSLNESND